VGRVIFGLGGAVSVPEGWHGLAVIYTLRRKTNAVGRRANPLPRSRWQGHKARFRRRAHRLLSD